MQGQIHQSDCNTGYRAMHQKQNLVHNVFTSQQIFKVASFSIKIISEYRQKIFEIFNGIWPLSLSRSSILGKLLKEQFLGFSVKLKNRQDPCEYFSLKLTCDTHQLCKFCTMYIVQLHISSITKRTKYFSFNKTKNRYKLLSAENLKKLSQNAENSCKIPVKIFLYLFPLGLKLERL